MDINLLHGDCLELMKDMPDKSVDLTVTSPPYDNLRSYNGNNDKWNASVWKSVITDLFRITKDGGVVVWIVADATIKGSETGTSFRQALYFKEIGFNIHDTMIYKKKKIVPTDPKNYRYYQGFEYMFIFSKGRPKTCNYIRVPSIHAGKKAVSINRKVDGALRKDRIEKQQGRTVSPTKIKSNIWEYASQAVKGHPAPFPEQLANDHIITWSNPCDVVFDPFMGSGTTGVACLNTNRNFIGMELDDKYFEIAKKRIGRRNNDIQNTKTDR